MPQENTVHEPKITASNNQEGVEDIVTPLRVKDKHQYAETSSAGVAGVPNGPRLWHVSDALWQAVVQHDAAGAAADNGPYGAPALRRSGKNSREMSIMKIVKHDGRKAGV